MGLTKEDEDQLRLLSVFHYVVAGLQALFSMFPIIHFVMGAALVFFPERLGEGDVPPQAVGWFFMIIASAIMAAGATLAVCVWLAGRYLAQRRRYMFCLVVAAVTAATCMPFGTVLGIFTIIVLMRPSVKAAFGYPASA